MGNFQENSNICRKEYFPTPAVFFSLSQHPAVLNQHQQMKLESYNRRFQDNFSVDRLYVWSETQLEYTQCKTTTIISVRWFIFHLPYNSVVALITCLQTFLPLLYFPFIDNAHWELLAVTQYHPFFSSRSTITPNATGSGSSSNYTSNDCLPLRPLAFHYICYTYFYSSSIFWFLFYVITWCSVTLNC